MLYYSEVDWMPYDPAQINADFEAEYDTAEYETKISSLIQDFRAWAKQHDPVRLASWKSAVKTLNEEDHYILVMIGLANGSLSTLQTRSSKQSLFRLVAIGLATGAAIIVLALVVIEIIARLRN